MTLAAGTYRVLSALDTAANLDVQGGSGAQGANLQLWGQTDRETNTQLFDVAVLDNGNVSIRSVFTGYAVDAGVAERDVVSGVNVSMWPWDTSNHQQWTPTEASAVTYNGVSYPAYLLRSAANSAVCLDAAGARTYPGTNVQAYTVNGSTGWAGQWWVFVPEDAYSRWLPVPTDLRDEGGGSSWASVTPSFACDWTSYQGRWRYRWRLASQATRQRGDWSTWRTAAGAGENDGWGGAGAASLDTTAADGRRLCPTLTPAAVDESADLLEVQFEARCFSDDGSTWRGGATSATLAAAPARTVTCTACQWTPEGLTLALTASGRSGGAWSVSGSIDGVALFTGATGAGSPLTVPQSALSAVPAEGAALALGWTYTTCDGTRQTGTSTVTVAYDGGTVTPTPALAYVDGELCEVTVGTTGARRVWYSTPDGLAEADVSDGVAEVAYPLGRAFTVYVVAYDEAGAVAGMWSSQQPARGVGANLWTWPGGWFAVRVGRGAVPAAAWSSGRTVNSDESTGRAVDPVTAARGRQVSHTVSGAMVDEVDGEGWRERVEALAAQRYATYRDADGHCYRVAITTVDYTHKEIGGDVSVTMRRLA